MFRAKRTDGKGEVKGWLFYRDVNGTRYSEQSDPAQPSDNLTTLKSTSQMAVIY